MPTSSQTLPVAFVAKIVAAPGHAEELGALLTGAVELANQETGTVVWFAVRSDEHTFWIFDAFPDTAARDAHAGGEIVAALGANSHLLGAPPEINAADVLAMKMP
ncbi:MAG: antibiotic biosynthesis monooxygenase [Actinomycetota bacterium]